MGFVSIYCPLALAWASAVSSEVWRVLGQGVAFVQLASRVAARQQGRGMGVKGLEARATLGQEQPWKPVPATFPLIPPPGPALAP